MRFPGIEPAPGRTLTWRADQLSYAQSSDSRIVEGPLHFSPPLPFPLSSSLSLSLSYVTYPLPLTYKEKGSPPRWRTNLQTRETGLRTLRTATTLHTTFRTPETWDQSPFLDCLYPLLQTNASNTSSHILDVGTFRSNQYKPLCQYYTLPGLDAQNTNLLVDDSRHRQVLHLYKESYGLCLARHQNMSPGL